jgi:dTMP kinase
VPLALHLFLAIAAVMLVGVRWGSRSHRATITGTVVVDESAAGSTLVQMIVRLTLLGSLSVVPVIVGLVSTYTLGSTALGRHLVVAVRGRPGRCRRRPIAYRQMDDRRDRPTLPDLLAALRRGEPREGGGALVGAEGIDAEEAADQATRLAARLRAGPHRRRARGKRRSRALERASGGLVRSMPARRRRGVLLDQVGGSSGRSPRRGRRRSFRP